jgi:gamma-glutamylcyclotransferase (GGCT)/AIG2-like uncharacterized protein YtfP
MVVHFAYGSNMNRTMMRTRCPSAMALGTARLPGWRFLITQDGYASILPASGDIVHGVLWRLSARDLAAVNAYEGLHAGLYRRHTLSVLAGSRRRQALAYIARANGEGLPRPGYLGLVVAAARDWDLPDDYIEALARWSPSRWRGERAAETGELA